VDLQSVNGTDSSPHLIGTYDFVNVVYEGFSQTDALGNVINWLPSASYPVVPYIGFEVFPVRLLVSFQSEGTQCLKRLSLCS
jgi:hypothetical protein